MNETNSEVLTGAVIYFPYMHKGTMTDSNGKFEINNLLPGTFDLLVSFIGFQTKIIKVNTDTLQSKLLIYLTEQTFETQEVIISGNRFSLQHENAIDIKSIKTDIHSDLEANFLNRLGKEPGVDMISKGNGIVKPVIRGLSNTNILFVDNGIRKENYQFSENHPYVIDDMGMERIEIIKGPASLLYGSDAVGGVIYSIPEKPALQNTISGNYTAKYSLNDGGIASNLSVKGAKENFHAGVGFGIKSFKDFTDAAGIQVPNSRFNNKSFKTNAGISYKFGKTDVYYDLTTMQLGLTIPAAISIIQDIGRNNNVWFQHLESHILALKNKFFIKSFMIDADFSYQLNNRKLNTVESLPVFTTVDMSLNTLGYNFKGTYSYKNNYQFITGIQGIKQKNKNYEAPNHIIPDADLFDFSAYILLSAKFMSKLNVLAGLRYDYRTVLTIAEPNSPAVNPQYSNFSYSAGLTYQITEKFLFRSNFASAQRTPNIAELTQNGPHGAFFEKGNSALQTQKNFEPDVSIHYHSDFVLFEMSGFYNKINEYIFLEKTEDTSTDGLLIYQYNQSDATIKGGEVGIKIMPIKTVKIYTNYSFIDAKQSDGSYLPFIPHNKIYSELKYCPVKSFLKFNISASVNSTYAFSQTKVSEFETVTPGYFVSNLVLSSERKLKSGKLNIAFSLNNLFNEVYIDHLSTLKELNYFAQGRNLIAVVKYVF